MVGRRKKAYFQNLITTVAATIASWKNRLLSLGGKVVLIKHVLSSLPLHLLATVSPPKSVFATLEHLFANFFWGSDEGGLKYHWIRWKDLCAPKKEGGLGFRSLDAVFNAFSIKLWWRFRQNASLWANFMMATYCSNAYPGMVVRSEGASHTWRRMLHVRDIAEQHITFIIHSGDSNFWFDNWLGSGPLAMRLGSVSDHKVSYFLVDGRWNFQLLGLWVPPVIINDIRMFSLPQIENGVEDLMIWAPSQSGVFTLSSAFNLVQSHKQRSFMFSEV